MESLKMLLSRSEIERNEGWVKIQKDIPTLKFNSEWDIKIIPPFAGAVARFLIFKKDEFVCSVYLDWYDNLGYVGEPYYELYPFEDDTRRYLLNETDDLLRDISILWKQK